MTNKKQIVIDGVDVSKCQDFHISRVGTGKCCYCDSDNTQFLACKDNPNCYFKQLSRKTQECKELKEELELNTQNAVTLDMAKRLYNYRKALEEIEEYFKTECVSCKEQYYNQHCEDCETQYFLGIISKAKGE